MAGEQEEVVPGLVPEGQVQVVKQVIGRAPDIVNVDMSEEQKAAAEAQKAAAEAAQKAREANPTSTLDPGGQMPFPPPPKKEGEEEAKPAEEEEEPA